MDQAILILILCIVINGLCGVVFKLYSKYDVNILYAILVNYVACITTGSIFLGHMPISLESMDQPWFEAAIGLGLVFVVVFNLYGYTIKHFGIVIGTIFQRMSMLAPAIVAILYYGESLTWPKGIGILLGILAIGFLSYQKSEKPAEQGGKSESVPLIFWLMPIGTFLGSCIIDSTLFLMEVEKIAPSGDISFVIHLFFFALIPGLFLGAFQWIKTKTGPQWKDVVGGIMLGVPNFFSIYLLLLVIASGWDASVVFPINNVGILSFAALLGFIIFKEAVTRNKVIGLSLAIISIVMISY